MDGMYKEVLDRDLVNIARCVEWQLEEIYKEIIYRSTVKDGTKEDSFEIFKKGD